jgi:hypothetical protein
MFVSVSMILFAESCNFQCVVQTGISYSSLQTINTFGMIGAALNTFIILYVCCKSEDQGEAAAPLIIRTVDTRVQRANAARIRTLERQAREQKIQAADLKKAKVKLEKAKLEKAKNERARIAARVAESWLKPQQSSGEAKQNLSEQFLAKKSTSIVNSDNFVHSTRPSAPPIAEAVIVTVRESESESESKHNTNTNTVINPLLSKWFNDRRIRTNDSMFQVLFEIGVQEPRDFVDLDEDDIVLICSKLNKIGCKKFRRGLEEKENPEA